MRKLNIYFLPLLVSVFVLFTACSDSNSSDPETDETIFGIASTNNDFNTLSQAIIDAGLQSTLEGAGPFTVFAPTDAAFDKLPDGLLGDLTDEQLAEILQYHVISGSDIASSQLQATQDVETLQGEKILIEAANGVLVNNFSSVVNADIEASNGVIHAIDEVLLPEGLREANIVDRAKELSIFTSLVGAVEDAGLTTTLQFKGDFTVFAPTDNAFSELPSGLLESLTTEQLAEILQYHVLSGEVFAANLQAEQSPASLTEESIFVTKSGEEVSVNQASVVTADVDVTNGVIHAIDQVILPDAYGTVVDAAAKRYFFSTLVEQVINAELADDLSNTSASFTLFAPTNEAFAKLPEGLLTSLTKEQLIEILSYHVIPAEVKAGDLSAEQAPEALAGGEVFVTKSEVGTVMVNANAEVIEADVDVNNGVIHAINEVILPDNFVDVVGIASKRFDLTTLVGAVTDAQLVEALSATTNDGFTVFAPVNSAFGELDAIPTGDALVDVLQYHVIPSKVLSGDLQATQTVETLNGDTVTITVENGVVSINGSTVVTTADLEGTNGVVHIIDEVLLPPAN
ncbi:MAG: fasciclin domain-containing protein [Balneola sp.]|nr:MAG: fasciclin domain-containing protein [Balneola sp.]